MTLREIFVTLSMLMAASQPLLAQPPGLEAHNASNAYINCLMQATHKLDDGRSSVDSVGRSVQASCVPQERRWQDALTVKLSAAQKRDFSEKMQAQIALITTRMVTEERRMRIAN